MNKVELIKSVATEAGITQAQAAKALDAVLSGITTALRGGDKVTLVNFGTFAVTERAARTGRNPRTNEEIQIPAKKVPKFKPGKQLIDAME